MKLRVKTDQPCATFHPDFFSVKLSIEEIQEEQQKDVYFLPASVSQMQSDMHFSSIIKMENQQVQLFIKAVSVVLLHLYVCVHKLIIWGGGKVPS